MATQSKTQFLTEVQTLLKKRYKIAPVLEKLTILEAVVYGISHEDSTREHANQALSRFKDGFFDWNEVRVSTVEEIQGVLAGIPDTEARATRIRRFLRQQLFRKDLRLQPRPARQEAAEEVGEGGRRVRRVRLRLCAGHGDPAGPGRPCHPRRRAGAPRVKAPGGRRRIDRSPDAPRHPRTPVPKNRGAESSSELIEELAHDTCIEGIPDCPRCELRKICPTGLARKAEAAARPSPRKWRKARPARPSRPIDGEEAKETPCPTPPNRPSTTRASSSAHSRPDPSEVDSIGLVEIPRRRSTAISLAAKGRSPT